MAHDLVTIPRAQSPAHVTLDEMERMATAFARSGLFGAKTPEAALSLLMIAQAEGIHPALAVMEYDIIEGKPARKAERLLARFQMSGGKVEWRNYTDTQVTGFFSHPQGSDVEIDWTIERAAKIKYYTKEGWKPLSTKYNWQNWPRAMLRSRVISEGVRACFPGASLVTLTVEEASDAGTDVIQAHIVDEDTSQDTEDAKGLIKGKTKDDLVAGFIDRMALATSDGEMAALWEQIETYKPGVRPPNKRYFSNAVFSGLETARDQHEDRIAKLNTAEAAMEHDIANSVASTMTPNGSPFETLKAAGVDCETPAALKAWALTLTPEALTKCTDSEVTELRNIYANKRDAFAEGAAA